MFAPGMQPATASMSCSKRHATSAAPGIGNDFSSWTFIVAGPPARPWLLSSVDAELVALLPHAQRVVRHVHVGHAQVCERVDDRVAEAGNAADVRRLGDALG